ncbi:MAG TPA: aldo/keto reductase [Steroidobacteraceae bacterium]|jgi:predicted oxidoreductase|nr:aldo/keto reductase [Steroidobacteraceae bacterium]
MTSNQTDNFLHHPTPAIGLWRITDWKYSVEEQVRWTEQVLDLGARVFDLADIYGNYEAERCFGLALKASPVLRKRFFLITKCGLKLASDKFPQHRVKHYDTSKQHIIASAEQSLKYLHTDHIDLLLIHRPDPLMDADEVVEAFTQLKQSGKVLNFGVSNFTPLQFELLESRLPFPLMTNQVEFSVLHTQSLSDGTFDQCQRLNISPMAWSPLGGGRLFNSQEEQPVRVRAALQTIGTELGLTIDQVAMAWIATHPARVVPITGSGKIENIRLALEASKVKLSRQQWFAILAASQGHEVP